MHRRDTRLLLTATLLAACPDAPNVTATLDTDEPSTSSGEPTNPHPTTTASPGDSTTANTSDTDASTSDASTSTGETADGTGTTAVSTSTSSDTGAGECIVAADCDDLFGPPACGTWACDDVAHQCHVVEPGCVDEDMDGFIFGPGCECTGIELDCDDSDADIGNDAVVDCYSGPPMTNDVGECHGGTSVCKDGVVGECLGEMTPAGEACNLLDDDCDGEVDELGKLACGFGACATEVDACVDGVLGSCIPAQPMDIKDDVCDGIDEDCDGPVDEECGECVAVATWGDDEIADGDIFNPFATIQAAIDWAASHPGPRRVCVAEGFTCGTNGYYTSEPGQTITMADGIDVLGGYEWNTWTRCVNSDNTILEPGTAAGVVFPADVQATTVLDGFTIRRLAGETSAAVTVDGAKGALISRLTIEGSGGTKTSYGISILNGGDATITRCEIGSTGGADEGAGVRVVGARVTIEDNCESGAGGHCKSFCNAPAIRSSGGARNFAVLLQDAPGSLLHRAAFCHNNGEFAAGVRIEGDATGVQLRDVFARAMYSTGATHAVSMDGCEGAAPWIVDSQFDSLSGVGIHAAGDCHPVVEASVIVSEGTGVECLADDQDVASRCFLSGNLRINAGARGVVCADGGCLRVERNLISGTTGFEGLRLVRTGTLVDANRIEAGCSPDVVGIHAEDAWARIRNNFIHGFIQQCPDQPKTSIGVRILASAGPREVELHSNTIHAGATPAQCSGRALVLGAVGEPPTAPVGVVRNNILGAGLCGQSRISVVELDAAVDPRIFENNDLDAADAPQGLYLDENSLLLATPGEVDALADTIAAGNLAVDAALIDPPGDLHIGALSPCIDAGTAVGAPLRDIDGAPRDASPDIGADER